MNPLGLILIVATVMIPLFWYMPLAAHHDNLAVISQYFGSVSLILMGIVQFLATRARGVESLFGGMDRIYVLHKWLAVAAIIFAAIHDTVDADMEGLGAETFLTDIAETLGEIGFYGLQVLGIVTVITFVPYQYWKWSHRFIGLFFAFSAIHFAFILKPFSNVDPLGLYVLFFCALGVFSYLYLLLPKHWTSQTVDYTVSNVVHTNDTSEVHLSPNGRGIRHKAGQFIFVTFNSEARPEPHPFTISAAPNEQRDIRLTIKKLGDYTAQIPPALTQGTGAKLSRAFGHFTQTKKMQPQIWVAAGVGITPFMAWAQTLDNTLSASVRLYYCVAERDKALYVSELETIAKVINNFEVVLVVSNVDKRLSATRIVDELNAKLAAHRVYFCGPSAMRKTLKTDLSALGLKPNAFYYEEFEIRSGIGIRHLLSWVFERYSNKLQRNS